MAIASRWLILAEVGARSDDIERVLARRGITSAYVVPEVALSGPAQRTAELQIVSFGDHVMAHGARDLALFARAEAAADHVQAVAHGHAGVALGYLGVDLPALAHYTLVMGHLYPAARCRLHDARILCRVMHTGLGDHEFREPA